MPHVSLGLVSVVRFYRWLCSADVFDALLCRTFGRNTVLDPCLWRAYCQFQCCGLRTWSERGYSTWSRWQRIGVTRSASLHPFAIQRAVLSWAAHCRQSSAEYSLEFSRRYISLYETILAKTGDGARMTKAAEDDYVGNSCMQCDPSRMEHRWLSLTKSAAPDHLLLQRSGTSWKCQFGRWLRAGRKIVRTLQNAQSGSSADSGSASLLACEMRFSESAGQASFDGILCF